MKRRAFTLLIALYLVTGCSHSADVELASTQERFGVQMARMNLWREALFRFQRAASINPASASAHNNVAVAYEANGDFDSAIKSYREAMRLDRSNQYIQKNYSRLVEFQSRNRKRQQQQQQQQQRRDAATAAPATPTATPATGQPPTPTPTPAPQPVPNKPPGGRA